MIAACVACALGFTPPSMDAQGGTLTQPAPEILTRTSREKPVSYAPVLTWTKESNAVAYELEFFSKSISKLDPQETDARAVFRTSDVYENAVNLPLDEMRKGLSDKQPLWWRVRALDIDGAAISPFSRLSPLYANPALPRMNAPLLHPVTDKGRGSAMLFPVYSWVRPYGATSFEVALYTEDPERKPDAAPIAKWIAPYGEQYDETPRMGDTTYYWRVRALDKQGTPGAWSATSEFRLEPQHWEIAVLGDSISHGGGHVSYNPEALEYSWLSYLNFPAVNLFYICNWDFGNNNVACWRARETDPDNEWADGKWRFILYDTEYSTGLYGTVKPDENAIERLREKDCFISSLFFGAMKNPEFRKKFAYAYDDLTNAEFDDDVVRDAVMELYGRNVDAILATYDRFWPTWPGGPNGANILVSQVQDVLNFFKERRQYSDEHVTRLLSSYW